MSVFTLRCTGTPSDAQAGAVNDCALRHGAAVSWQANPGYERTYALIEGAAAGCAAEMRAAAGDATVFDRPIIALALSPSVPEALSAIERALGGLGRPAGIVGCERAGASLIVEWDLDRTGYMVVLGLVDVEIARYRARCVNALLSPLPLAWWTGIAAEGLKAPDITPSRVLEALLEDVHVAD